MLVEQAIQALLATDAAIVMLVGDRVYPGVAPQSAPLPRIEWGVLTQEPDIAHSGRTGCDRYMVEVQSVSASYGEAKQLAGLVEAALDPIAAPGKSSAIGVVFKDDETDQTDFAGSGGDQRIRTIVQRYVVWTR